MLGKALKTAGTNVIGQTNFVSPATKLLEKRRQMYEIQEQFEQQKDEFKKQEKNFKSKENDIKQKDNQIQEELIKFCKVLQETEAKKNRALKRFQDEERGRRQQELKINEINEQITEHQKYLVKLEKKVSSLKKYEDYLDNVIKTHNNEFSDLGEILSRYKNLEISNIHLLKHQEILENKLEQLKSQSSQYTKEKNNEILQLNNDIKEYEKKIEEKNNELNSLQSSVEANSSEISSKTMNFERIVTVIDNLFQRCLQKKKGKTQIKEKEETQVQEDEDYIKKGETAIVKLKQISTIMQDFKEIIKKFDKYKKKDAF